MVRFDGVSIPTTAETSSMFVSKIICQCIERGDKLPFFNQMMNTNLILVQYGFFGFHFRCTISAISQTNFDLEHLLVD